jgi:hypothetical protein
MKSLRFALCLLPLLACQDGTLVQPELTPSPELGLAQAAVSHGDLVKMVPASFAGDWWVADVVFDGCGGDPTLYYSVLLEGSGTGSHLGRYFASWTVCWGFDGTFVSSAGTITAANGDILNFYGSQEHGTTHPFYPDGTWELTNGYYDGGTGRFEHAEGSYDCAGTYNETITGGTMRCQGMISSVGSSK